MQIDVGLYLLGGITLVSELVLPEVPRIQQEHTTPHPVSIRIDAVTAPQWPQAVEIDPDCFATPSLYYVVVKGVASYLVSQGREIIVSPHPGAPALDVRAYLLGSIFVVLCQQRGLLPLHASALAGRSGAVAFLGHSGQGKSSLAAHLAQRNFAVLADDVCLIDPAEADGTMVIPTAPWLKLWRDSLEGLGRPVVGLARVFSDDDKYRLPTPPALKPEPIRTLMFLPAREATSTETKIEEISATAAIPLLMNLTHHAYVLQATGQRQESFLRCSRVCSQARAYRLVRPWGLVHLKTTLDVVQELLES